MSRLLVGDDVVDLDRERTVGKASDERFLARVLTPDEIGLVRGSADPDLELWTLWACKEAAYKIHSKARGEPPTFVHATYRVKRTLAEAPGGSRPAEGRAVPLAGTRGEEVSARVRWPGGAADVGVRRGPGVVHAVGWAQRGATLRADSGPRPRRGSQGPPLVPTDHQVAAELARLDDPEALWSGPLTELLERLTPTEADAVHSRSSAAVRIAARRTVAELLALDEARLQIVCAPGDTGRRPPSVLLDGAPCDVDVSFTHDGRWIAWVVSVPRLSRRDRARPSHPGGPPR